MNIGGAEEISTSGQELGVGYVQHPRPHRVFYLSGQTVVFKVKDALFKVDPTLFTNGEDSAFKTMLTLPPGDSIHEGNDDENPIVLQGDTPEEFGFLLWGLYSQHISQASVSEEIVENFLQLVNISHKYNLLDLEAWATSGLHRLAQNNSNIRRSRAAQFLRIFTLCNCTLAVTMMVSTIREMLVEKACSASQITSFIDMGQSFGLPDLVGFAYYTMMLKPRSEWEAESSFTHEHRYRLLNGHYALSEYSLDGIITSLRDDFRGYHPSWANHWTAFAVALKEAELRSAYQLKVVDIVGRLRRLLEGFLDKLPSSDDSHKPVFRALLEKRINSFIENELPKHFADVKSSC